METLSFGEKEKPNSIFLNKIKHCYQKRFESLEQILQKLIDKISGQDELLLALQDDSVSANFIGVRIREILELGLLKEKENYIEILVLEKSQLLDKIEQLEKNDKASKNDKIDLENQLNKLLKEKEEMKSLETKCFNMLDEMQVIYSLKISILILPRKNSTKNFKRWMK